MADWGGLFALGVGFMFLTLIAVVVGGILWAKYGKY
jgi:hypothetical protein